MKLVTHPQTVTIAPHNDCSWSMDQNGVHQRTIPQEVLKISIGKMSLRNTFVKLLPNLIRTNELIHTCVIHNFICPSFQQWRRWSQLTFISHVTVLKWLGPIVYLIADIESKSFLGNKPPSWKCHAKGYNNIRWLKLFATKPDLL